MAALELIEQIVVDGSSPSSVTFSSLGAYQHLMIVSSARSLRSGNEYDGSNTRFNGETSGNNQSHYALIQAAVDSPTGGNILGASGASENRVAYLFDSAAAGAPANYFGYNIVYFPNYRWGEYKKVIGRSSVPNDELDAWSYQQTVATGSWRSTSAVTSIQIAAGVTGWAEHSTFTLYGINSA